MDPAFTWQGDIEQTISRKRESQDQKRSSKRDQIAAELVLFFQIVY